MHAVLTLHASTIFGSGLNLQRFESVEPLTTLLPAQCLLLAVLPVQRARYLHELYGRIWSYSLGALINFDSCIHQAEGNVSTAY